MFCGGIHTNGSGEIININNYLRLKGSISRRNSQREDIEKVGLIEQGKIIWIDEILKQNERQHLRLKAEV